MPAWLRACTEAQAHLRPHGPPAPDRNCTGATPSRPAGTPRGRKGKNPCCGNFSRAYHPLWRPHQGYALIGSAPFLLFFCQGTMHGVMYPTSATMTFRGVGQGFF